MIKHLHLTVTFCSGDSDIYEADYKTAIDDITTAMKNNLPLMLVSVVSYHKIMINPNSIKTIEFIPFETEN